MDGRMMMSEKVCKNCRFWKDPSYMSYGICQSRAVAASNPHGELGTTPNFGCIHWKEKKPDVRGMVAMYLCGLLGESLLYHQQPNRVKNVYLAHADAIFAIIREADE